MALAILLVIGMAGIGLTNSGLDALKRARREMAGPAGEFVRPALLRPLNDIRHIISREAAIMAAGRLPHVRAAQAESSLAAMFCRNPAYGRVYLADGNGEGIIHCAPPASRLSVVRQYLRGLGFLVETARRAGMRGRISQPIDLGHHPRLIERGLPPRAGTTPEGLRATEARA